MTQQDTSYHALVLKSKYFSGMNRFMSAMTDAYYELSSRARTHVHSFTRTQAHTYTHARTRTYTRTCTHKHTRTQAHTYMHARRRKYTHKHTRIQFHTRAKSRALARRLLSLKTEYQVIRRRITMQPLSCCLDNLVHCQRT